MLRLAFILLAIPFLPHAAYAELWGSSKSRSYHFVTCRYVKKTWKGYRVTFPSASDARKAGYKPCETCRPPDGLLQKKL